MAEKIITEGIQKAIIDTGLRREQILVAGYKGGEIIGSELGLTGPLLKLYGEILEKELLAMSLEKSGDLNAKDYRVQLNAEEKKLAEIKPSKSAIKKSESEEEKIIRLAANHAWRILVLGENEETVRGIEEYKTQASEIQRRYASSH